MILNIAEIIDNDIIGWAFTVSGPLLLAANGFLQSTSVFFIILFRSFCYSSLNTWIHAPWSSNASALLNLLLSSYSYHSPPLHWIVQMGAIRFPIYNSQISAVIRERERELDCFAGDSVSALKYYWQQQQAAAGQHVRNVVYEICGGFVQLCSDSIMLCQG